MIGQDVETRIQILVFKPVHTKVEIIQHGKPTDKPIQFGHRRLDHDVVPLVSRTAFVFPAESIADTPDPVGVIRVGSFLVGLKFLTCVRPAVRADLIGRVALEPRFVDVVFVDKHQKRELLGSDIAVATATHFPARAGETR